MAIKAPNQARSKATMQKLIAAALELVEQHPWEEVSITEIVRVAGSSVGAFYARFGNKATLLEQLDEYYAEQMIAIFEQFVQSETQSVQTSIEALLRGMVNFHRQHKGLIKTLILTARTNKAAAYTSNTKRLNQLTPRIIDRLLCCADFPQHVSHRKAKLVLTFTFSAMREQLLFPEAVPAAAKSDRELITSLGASFVGGLHGLANL